LDNRLPVLRSTRIAALFLAIVTTVLPVTAFQDLAREPTCPDVVNVFPVLRREPVRTPFQPRFEIRQCTGSLNIEVAVFEKGAKSPAITLEVLGWPRLLVHTSNVLVLQTVGGSTSAVYIFSFAKGRAQQLISAETRGTATVRIDDVGAKVIIDVPENARIGFTIPARHYEIGLDVSQAP
jgi:hypothetical protein